MNRPQYPVAQCNQSIAVCRSIIRQASTVRIRKFWEYAETVWQRRLTEAEEKEKPNG